MPVTSAPWYLCVRRLFQAALLGTSVTSCLLASQPIQAGGERTVKSDIRLPTERGDSLVREIETKELRATLDLGQQVLRVQIRKEMGWREKNRFKVGDSVRLKRAVTLKADSGAVVEIPAGTVLLVAKHEQDEVETSVLVKGKVVHGSFAANKAELVSDESPPRPTLKGAISSDFVSAAVLMQKAKQFDDGLYAAVDLAAEKGAGRFAGKVDLLKDLARELGGSDGQLAEPYLVILAACLLGKVPVDLSPAVREKVQAAVNEFQQNALRSKPIGFYTWSDPLKEIFQQDRMLQSELKGREAIGRLVKLLQADKGRRAAYENYLQLVSRLTNPLAKPDLTAALKALDAGTFVAPADNVYFFPPSVGQETELLKRMFPNGDVPASFNLAETLVEKVQSGELDLRPRPNSGWYDHQVYSLEPLVVPEKMPEAAHLSLNDEYKEHLIELFKGVWALTRETHIKQLEIPDAASAAMVRRTNPKPVLEISPQLHAEPLATMYLRRARSYRFVRNVLENAFGPQALAAMHRQTSTGSVGMNLAAELGQMEALFYGAAFAVNSELGLKSPPRNDVGSSKGAAADAQVFLDWAANLQQDPDLSKDSRMMVPVYHDLRLRQTKVWVFLGWTTQRCTVSFSQRPKITITSLDGRSMPIEDVDLKVRSSYETIATPVVAELFVDRILNRDEFRLHCDTYKSTAAILSNLKPAKSRNQVR